jgi:ABC-2 type transport system ATP-binding protein
VLDGTLSSIQEQYGSDTIRLRTQAGLAATQNLEGIESVTDFGQAQELRLKTDCDPQKILAALMSRTRIMSFEITKPSLHDIFVRIAQPHAKE